MHHFKSFDEAMRYENEYRFGVLDNGTGASIHMDDLANALKCAIVISRWKSVTVYENGHKMVTYNSAK